MIVEVLGIHAYSASSTLSHCRHPQAINATAFTAGLNFVILEMIIELLLLAISL